MSSEIIRSRKMGVLHSIIRFLCCKTQTEQVDEESDEKSPLLVYQANEDSSTSYVKGILQKLRKAASAADPILPIQNPAPGNYYNDSSAVASSPGGGPTTYTFLSEMDTDGEASEYSSGDAIGIDHILDWAILSAEVASANTSASVADFKTKDRQQRLQPKTSSKKTENVVVPVVEQSKKIVKKRKGKKREVQGDQGIIVKSGSTATVVVEERWIKHYSSRHRILVVGDGDFSFSACLAVAFGGASNMIATSLNSEVFLKENYPHAASNIEKLRSRGCKVMHGIDATKMASDDFLGRQLKFDRVIFNFPHAGFSRKDELGRHQRLVGMFMKNAREMISENGEIHISHKTTRFHRKWNLESIASSHNLRLIEAVKFHHRDYPGYSTKYGFGGNKHFNCNPSRTYKFGLETVRF